MSAKESGMRGAGNEGENRANPPVRSKFDRSHGMGLKAPHLSHPGEVAPETGTKVRGFTEHGHMLPHHIKEKPTDSIRGKSETVLGTEAHSVSAERAANMAGRTGSDREEELNSNRYSGGRGSIDRK